MLCQSCRWAHIIERLHSTTCGTRIRSRYCGAAENKTENEPSPRASYEHTTTRRPEQIMHILHIIIMCDRTFKQIWRISRPSNLMACEGSIPMRTPRRSGSLVPAANIYDLLPLQDKRHGVLFLESNPLSCPFTRPRPAAPSIQFRGQAPSIAAARKPCHLAVGKSEDTKPDKGKPGQLQLFCEVRFSPRGRKFGDPGNLL